MSTVLAQLAAWIDAWAPAELTGGFKGRSAEELPYRLWGAISESLATGGTLAGAKLDLRKCFDKACPEQAVYVLERLGIPAGVAAVLRCFYDKQQVWVESEGAAARTPLTRCNGLLQGCPASCMLIAALATVWVQTLKRECPDVETGLFVDDRTMWTSAADPEAKLERAFDVSKTVDEAMHFECHSDKGETSATSARGRKNLAELAKRVGLVRKQCKLIGVRYNTTKARRAPAEPKWAKLVEGRLRRITAGTRSHARRKHAVRTLVLPLFAFVGSWTRPSKKCLEAWRLKVERAVLGKILPGRSRFLTWVCRLGAFCDPVHALDLVALRHEQWKCKRRAVGRDMLQHEHSRFSEAATCWGWTKLSDESYGTAQGTLHLAWDGAATIDQAARLGWEASLWKAEPRAQDHATLQQSRGAHPVYARHKAWCEAPDTTWTRIAAAQGAAHDARLVEAVQKQPTWCRCGEASPHRRHITWHCLQRTDTAIRRFTNGAEEGLLVPMARLQVLQQPRSEIYCMELADALRQQRAWKPSELVLCATDGGSTSDVLEGVAFRGGDWGAAAGTTAVGGELPGLDQTPGMAETWGLVQAARAAKAAGVPCHFLLDNRNVLSRGRTAARGIVTVVSSPAAWKHLKELLEGSGSQLSWVPAHGKHEEWQPPAGHCGSAWRQLNDMADREASKHAKRALERSGTARRSRSQALSWAQRALQLHHSSMQAWWNSIGWAQHQL